jgi:hypothetical protein
LKKKLEPIKPLTREDWEKLAESRGATPNTNAVWDRDER